MPRQLSFDLPAIPAHGRDDFFVSAANSNAVAMVEGWQGWPERKLLLIGPTGAGKTHLAHVWAGLARAAIVPAAALPGTDIAALAGGSVAVEDVDAIAGRADAEEALFHLHNLVLADGHSLLLSACSAPAGWPLGLPDLASRLQATPTAHLQPPDDALLAAVVLKLFRDRQITPPPDLVPYLVRRIERSFAAARDIVTDLDAAALETGRTPGRALARELLDNAARRGQSTFPFHEDNHGGPPDDPS